MMSCALRTAGCAILATAAVSLGLVGCSDRSVEAGGSADSSTTSAILPEADRRHDFGLVVSKPGVRRSHVYRLVNKAGRAVEIVAVKNLKTCCGRVHVERLQLAPGESTEVEVTLLLDDKFGQVLHEAEVWTDHPQERLIKLETSASAVPSLRVEADGESADGQGTSVWVGQKRPAKLRVSSAGTSDDPPIDLDAATIQSEARCSWIGPSEESAAGGGVLIRSRPFEVVLDESDRPGERSVEVVFKVREEGVMRHTLTWNVVPTVATSPQMIIIRPGTTTYRVVVNSQDRRPFRVLGVESDSPSILGKVESKAAAPTHVIEVECGSPPDHARGTLQVVTDLESPGRIEVPYMTLD